jgi:hypothetical protein
LEEGESLFIKQLVYVKHEGKVQIGTVEIIWDEELEIKLENGETIHRKFWEIKKVPNDK